MWAAKTVRESGQCLSAPIGVRNEVWIEWGRVQGPEPNQVGMGRYVGIKKSIGCDRQVSVEEMRWYQSPNGFICIASGGVNPHDKQAPQDGHQDNQKLYPIIQLLLL